MPRVDLNGDSEEQLPISQRAQTLHDRLRRGQLLYLADGLFPKAARLQQQSTAEIQGQVEVELSLWLLKLNDWPLHIST